MKKAGKKRGKSTLVVALLLLAGLCVLAYPFVSDRIATRAHVAAVVDYQNGVKALPTQEEKRLLQQARDYNARLGGTAVEDPFTQGSQPDTEYEDQLSVGGVMGSIQIPEIGVDLPIYHGTSDQTLAKGVGHLYGTSLPVGGAGTHAVLTGHRGLPSATLFTDLDKLKEGDRFYIEVLDETLAYQVDQIKVVEPTDTTALQIEPGKDYVTLLTCTPYGINSHRLLVRGARVEMPPQQAKQEVQTVLAQPGFLQQWWWLLLLAAAAVAVALLLLRRRVKKHKQKRGV